MVNLFAVVNPLLNGLMKLAGLQSQTVEIEAGTAMRFWSPTKNKKPMPSVVLLHGFAGNGTITWVFQALALAGKYRVYVPDLLFFGGSTTSSANRSPEFQAECVAKGLKKLGVERCAVVGFSYGGIVGLRMGEMDEKLVQSVVVSGAGADLPESLSEAVFQRLRCESWADLLLPTTVEGLKALFVAGTHKMLPLPDWAYRHYLEVMFDNRRERGELLHALVDINQNHSPHSHFPMSIHFLVGEHDKIFNLEAVNNAKEELGNKTKVHIVKKAGHLAHLERPCVYNRFLKTILGDAKAADQIDNC